MKRLSEDIAHFFRKQNFVIVSTLDEKGLPHSSCKGIVAIKESGKVILFDLYRGQTYKNLRRNARMSITAVDEHTFEGYCLKGRAHAVSDEQFPQDLLAAWDERITSRITQRLLRNVRLDTVKAGHAEALLPKPQYLIVMAVEDAVSLRPHHLKGKV